MSMPMVVRFVILRHEGVPEPHFDVMFETAPASPLATWRSDVWPITSPTWVIRLPDHRRAYLEYEGPVSGNRGFVQRVADGTCEIEQMDHVWQVRFLDPAELGVLKLVETDPPHWAACRVL